jgi:hypothetical protein
VPIHVEPLVATVRFLPRGTYGDPFDATCTLRWTAPDAVFVSALAGTMTRAYWNELRDWLKAAGVREVTMRRRGKVVTLPVQ